MNSMTEVASGSHLSRKTIAPDVTTDSLLSAAALSVCLRFERQAALFPDRTALTSCGRKLTYRQLNDRTDALAQRLLKRGIRSGDLVGVMLERSFELIVSLLAVLKVGAVYVPLDCDYLAERLSWMAVDANLRAVLTSRELMGRLPAARSEMVLVETLDLEAPDGPAPATSSSGVELNGEQLAYVMYTSGSTGIPKGVAIPHRGIVRLVCNADYVDIGPTDVFLQASPVSFDASTFEIWGALLNGAQLALLPPGHPSLRSIAEAIHREKITVLWLTAGLFNLMVDERLDDLKPVRQLLTGGEVLSVPHVERALAHLSATQLINGYGPTENTTFTCCFRISPNERLPRGVPIGRPIHGTRVHIVDEALRELPVEEVGELVTGGLGLALGYWNRPDLTAERFVADPFSLDPKAKLYRTGDLAWRRPDGIIEFVGRRDTQVKIRGFRIELGEVEAVLKQHPGIRDCTVAASENPGAGKYLVAYVIPTGSAPPQADELRHFLAARLPAHMVPSAWAVLPQLPLNPNGKLDRARLPRVEPLAGSESCEPPSTELERVIASLWRELLGERPFGVSDSFFDVGGDSLHLTCLHERLCGRIGISMPLTDLFRFPTVRSLAKHLEDQQQAPAAISSSQRADRRRLQHSALQRFRRS
jgi:amino acid adenylation domain-containing protein